MTKQQRAERDYVVRLRYLVEIDDEMHIRATDAEAAKLGASVLAEQGEVPLGPGRVVQVDAVNARLGTRVGGHHGY